MKTLNLHQKACLNTGVIGELKLGGLTIQTLEGRDCLKSGTYTVEFVGAKLMIDGDYPVCMNANGAYRSKGLCVGMEWDYRVFDLKKKGDAFQALFSAIKGKAKIVVTRAGEDLKNKLVEALEEKNSLEDELAQAEEALTLAAEASLVAQAEQTAELKDALRWLLGEAKVDGTSTEAHDALAEALDPTIEPELNESDDLLENPEGDDNELNGTDGSTEV